MTNPIPVNDPPPTARVHDRAAILSIGDELVIGQALDTNSQWLSEQLTDRGVHVGEHRTLPDDLPTLTEAFRKLTHDYPLLIVTGGLGPTADDITRDALAHCLNEQLVEDPRGVRALEDFARKLGRTLNENNRRQACRPESARLIDNDHGTAPGIHADCSACDVFCLPGPPAEMRPMFEHDVLTTLNIPIGQQVVTRLIRTYGMGESDIAAVLGDLMKRDRNPLVGTTASQGVVTVRIRGEGAGPDMRSAVADLEERVNTLFPDHVFATGETSLVEAAFAGLRRRAHRLALAESCTGGLLAEMITSLAGSSDVFEGGFVTYANRAKIDLLTVPAELIDQHGAVSQPVTRAMAIGTLQRFEHANHALAVSGIAGPAGGTEDKPVGTVCIARASRDHPDATVNHDVRTFRFRGDRTRIRQRAAQAAYAMLTFHLQARELPPTIWQTHPPATPEPGR